MENIDTWIGKKVILIKDKDTKYNGKHPNSINAGYTANGTLVQLSPYVYVETADRWFHTSLVQEIKGNKIYTLNSIYTIKLVEND